MAASCGSEAVTPIPRESLGAGRCWLAASSPRSHTQSSLYGNKTGGHWQLQPQGNPGLGFLRGHNQAFVLTLTHPHPGRPPRRVH